MKGIALLVIGFAIALPRPASACSCVVGTTPVVIVTRAGDLPPNPAIPPPATVPEPFAIPPDWKGMFATGRVMEIRRLPTRSMNAVVIQVGEGLLNAQTGSTITVYTAVSGDACGYSFVQGRDYVIEGAHFDSGFPPEWYAGVPRGSQIVNSCSRTKELFTPEGDQALEEIQEAVRKIPR